MIKIDEAHLKQIVRKCLREAIEHNNLTNQLEKQVKTQAKTDIDGLPIIYGCNYVPKDKGIEQPDLQKRTNEFVLCFKNDNDKFPSNKYQTVKANAINYFNKVLVKCFGDNINAITLLGVPCHDKKSNELRWKDVLNRLCGNRMANGYDHITYKGETLPSHINKGHLSGLPDIEYDKSFFRGKLVVLIDDLYTTGTHIKTCKEQLEKCGATVILAITLAKTLSKDK